MALVCGMAFSAFGQITQRQTPEEWQQLCDGGRFIDRFLPMQGSKTDSSWGADGVAGRYIDNGIEDRIWSFWGGNMLQGDDGQWHLFVCGWLECSKSGHFEWPRSYVFHAVGNTSHGPFSLRDMVGRGHNPEVYRARNGQYVVYVIDGRYVADSLDGPWTYGKYDFDANGKKIIDGLSNLSFAQRPDSTFLMVDRGGGIWESADGLTSWRQVSDGSVYPKVEGNFEDPVLWRDEVQYNMIVNDWRGRIAYYLRSADGLHWVVDPGEAYKPGIARHLDGSEERWFKYERMKVVQDEHGRTIQANFAVIDVAKGQDKGSDNHSSKNICIPLNPGLLLSIENCLPVSSKTRRIQLRIRAEKGFSPAIDLDLPSLRFGASDEVNVGRGSKAVSSHQDGNDLIVEFAGKTTGIATSEFAPKLIGRYSDGRMCYGYARNY